MSDCRRTFRHGMEQTRSEMDSHFFCGARCRHRAPDARIEASTGVPTSGAVEKLATASSSLDTIGGLRLHVLNGVRLLQFPGMGDLAARRSARGLAYKLCHPSARDGEGGVPCSYPIGTGNGESSIFFEKSGGCSRSYPWH